MRFWPHIPTNPAVAPAFSRTPTIYGSPAFSAATGLMFMAALVMHCIIWIMVCMVPSEVVQFIARATIYGRPQLHFSMCLGDQIIFTAIDDLANHFF